MLKILPLQQIKVDGPALIEISNGVVIHVDENRNVFIDGHDKLVIRSQDSLEIDAKTISINAQEDVYIGSGKNITQQSSRIDLNPDGEASGYKGRK